jgi:SAM-dependent methyltransferase
MDADIARATQLLQLIGEPNRVRLLALLDGSELTVAELVSITELAQSRVSTHLGRLREAALLRDRRVGTATFYSLNDAAMPEDARELWNHVRHALKDDVLQSDRSRREALLRARGGEAWPESIAGEMERHYSPGRTWEAYARGLLGLIDLEDVLDIGSGDGAIAQMLAPQCRRITCLDRSERVLDAAKKRLEKHGNVSFQLGDVHEMPFKDSRFDAALMFNVLSYTQKPARALTEVSRVLRKGGLLALVTLASHNHEDITAAYGHQNAGFEERALEKLLAQANFQSTRIEVAMREKREPHFRVITAFARKG